MTSPPPKWQSRPGPRWKWCFGVSHAVKLVIVLIFPWFDGINPGLTAPNELLRSVQDAWYDSVPCYWTVTRCDCSQSPVAPPCSPWWYPQPPGWRGGQRERWLHRAVSQLSWGWGLVSLPLSCHGLLQMMEKIKNKQSFCKLGGWWLPPPAWYQLR